MTNDSTLVLRRRDPLALEIQRVLREDLVSGAGLMQPRYRQDAIENESFEGYCAVASAAYFFLGGRREAGLQPMQATHRGGSHWWIVKDQRFIIDLTVRPGDRPPGFSYQRGKARGFVQTGYTRPSKRAAELIARVKAARRARSATSLRSNAAR
jgi:hypothetical protein